MPIDEELTDRMRAALEGLPGVTEKRMMGGVCFLLAGNMIGAARRDAKTGDGWFLFRVGKANEAEAAGRPGAVPMVHGGRRMTGFFHVPELECDAAAMADWISLSLGFVGSLPPKT